MYYFSFAEQFSCLFFPFPTFAFSLLHKLLYMLFNVYVDVSRVYLDFDKQTIKFLPITFAIYDCKYETNLAPDQHGAKYDL